MSFQIERAKSLSVLKLEMISHRIIISVYQGPHKSTRLLIAPALFCHIIAHLNSHNLGHSERTYIPPHPFFLCFTASSLSPSLSLSLPLLSPPHYDLIFLFISRVALPVSFLIFPHIYISTPPLIYHNVIYQGIFF